VVTRIVGRIPIPLHLASGFALSLMLGLALGLAWPSHSEAAKLSRYLTSEDLAGRVLLDQNGQQLQLSTTGHHHLVIPDGSTPTYMAIPLSGGEHLPGSIPNIVAVSAPGEATVGPLNVDTQLKAALNTDLETSRLAIVETSARKYLVEFLPGAARAGAATGTNAASNLAHLLSTGSTQLSKLTQTGTNELDKLLNISGSNKSTSKPSLNLEAQELGSALPPPIPEPSAWLVFAGLALATAGLRRRMLRRVMEKD
jgi:hypothetical protein